MRCGQRSACAGRGIVAQVRNEGSTVKKAALVGGAPPRYRERLYLSDSNRPLDTLAGPAERDRRTAAFGRGCAKTRRIS